MALQTRTPEYIRDCINKMHRGLSLLYPILFSTINFIFIFPAGSLLLKQESNGLHLRWLVLDQESKYIYWLNPRKDVLIIDKDTSIDISTITQVVLSPDAEA